MNKRKTLRTVMVLLATASMILSMFSNISFASEAQTGQEIETTIESYEEPEIPAMLGAEEYIEVLDDTTVLWYEGDETSSEEEEESTSETSTEATEESSEEGSEDMTTEPLTKPAGEVMPEMVPSENEDTSEEETPSEEGEKTDDKKLIQLQEKIDAIPDTVLDGTASNAEEELAQYYAAKTLVDEIEAELEELTDEEYDKLDLARFEYFAITVYSLYQPICNIAAASIGAASNASGASTVTVTAASKVWLIPNVGCWDYYFELSNGAVAYCGEALATHPGTGTTVSVSEYTGSNAELIKKVLYYGSDGAGAVISSSQVDRARTGFALSYVYSGADVEDVYSMGGISQYSGTGARFANQVSEYSAVPSNYKLYMCSCGSGYQALFYLSYESEGYVTLNKSTSADTSNNPLTGALYGIYSDASCTNWKGYFITGAMGTGYVAKWTTNKSEIPSAAGDCYNYYDGYYYYADTYDKTITLDEGTYYLREEAAPAGYKKNSGTYGFTVSAGVTTALTATVTGILNDELSDGYLYIQKSSANPDICDGNRLYSLEGAEYKIYSAMSLSESSLKATLTTDESGKTEKVKLPEGTYYIVESKASPGHLLQEEATAPRFIRATITTLNTQDNPCVVKSTDPIETDPLIISITKESTEDYIYAFPLNGAIFKICYYDNLNGDHTGTPARIWKISTRLNASENGYAARLDESDLTADSDPLYYVDGEARLLLGTYTIEEIEPADGYSLKGSMYFTDNEADAVSTDGGVLVKIIDSDSILNPIQTRNSIKGYNIPVKMDTEALINGLHYADTDAETTVIKDSVSMTNINVGGTYRLKGTLYDQDTKEAVATEVVEFTASAENQTVDVEFTLDTDLYIGKHLIAGEVLEQYVNGTWYKTGEETDLAAEKQTVHFPAVSTTLRDNVTNSNIAGAGSVTFTDTVTYNGLISGKPYTLSGKLVDKATGKVAATNSTAFAATAPTADITLSFKFTAEENHTYVAYEYISENGAIIAKHENINDEAQTVYIPKIKTSLADTADNAKDAYAAEEITLVDTVTYENLIIGKEYKVTGRLMDKSTGEAILDDNGEEIASETAFTAETVNGTVEVTFIFSGVTFAGKTLVAFEDLYSNNKKVATHADIEDEEQTVYIPKIKTSFADTADNAKDAYAAEEITLVDTVTYENLIIGKEYKVTGRLMDKSTGEAILDDNGEEIASETAFTAETANGSVDVTFTFNGVTLAGKTLVAFEDLYSSNKKVATHADIEDEEQTVYIPKIKTSLADAADNAKDAYAAEEITLVDTVTYENLIVGKEYKVTGRLMDKSTGEAILDDNGEEIASETAFTAETANGTVEVTFIFNGVTLAGKTLVAFEDLYSNNKKVATHADIEDEAQTVYIPKIKTSLADAADNAKDAYAAEEITLVDTVTYENLIVGKEYKVTGKMMDKSTGEAILDDNGEEIASETVFTAETANGTVEVTFIFSGVTLAGKTLVAFEDLYSNNKKVATHADIEDEEQTVYIPKIKTSLADTADNAKDAYAAEEITLVDTVTYENLIVGKEYKVTGKLMDKTTGDAILDDNGEEIASETAFTAETANGSVDVTFTFNGVTFAGKTLVAFEDLYSNNKKVATHADIEDEAQTVYIPKIKTSLADAADNAKDAYAAEEITLVDTVTYENLIIGKEYKVTGKLMDKSTGEAILDDNGEEIASETAFTAETVNGTVEVTFIFSGVTLAGKTLVAVEDLYSNNKKVATHADIEDEEQSVHIPEIKTNLVDFTDGGKHAKASQGITLTDTIIYKNLIPGTAYTAIGLLYDKSTNKPAVDDNGERISAMLEFVAENTDGTVELTFTFSAESMTNTTLVAIENIYRGEKRVASHADIEDYDQSVFIPQIRTTLLEKKSGSHSAYPCETITLIDTVEYNNLIAGNTYTVTGVLMDKKTGKTFKDTEGNEIKAESVFTAETSDGTVEVTFAIENVPQESFAVVAFETLAENGKEIAIHADIDDYKQTVNFEVPHRTPQTGDIYSTALYLVLSIIALAALLTGAIILVRKESTDM